MCAGAALAPDRGVVLRPGGVRARLGRLVVLATVLLGPAAAHAATPVDNAPVPSLCGHPAGTLQDGVLPGIPENEGSVELAALHRGSGMVATATLREAGDIAAVVSCNRGGVAWPDNVVVWTPALEIIGVFELGEITKGGRESVHALKVRGNALAVEVEAIGQRGDIACCGTAAALLTLRWAASSNRMIVVSTTRYTERPIVRQFVAAINRGRYAQARRFGSTSAVNSLRRVRANGGRIRLGRCHGRLDDEWWITFEATWARACVVGVDYRSGHGQAIALHVAKRGWNGFRVTAAQGIAG